MGRSRARRFLLGVVVFAVWQPYAAAQTIPDVLSDREFWQMVTTMSEANGTYVSDNRISNEIEFQRAIPAVLAADPHSVYVGVGPEQNFTYIASFKPSLAFIVDIRRGNMLLHLTYKALIELSDDRVQFLSRLFARAVPAGVGRDGRARELLEAFAAAAVDEQLAADTLQAVFDRLEGTHHFTLSAADRANIAVIYRSLYLGGPNGRGDFGDGAWIPSYAELMVQTDSHGSEHSYLESNASFQTVKTYELNNLIVPLVGDFAGRRAIKDIGIYVRTHHATVGTFYASNVEDYLYQAGAEGRFLANVSGLPITAESLFIRSFFTHSESGMQTFVDSIDECLTAAKRGDIRSYEGLIERSRAPR